MLWGTAGEAGPRVSAHLRHVPGSHPYSGWGERGSPRSHAPSHSLQEYGFLLEGEQETPPGDQGRGRGSTRDRPTRGTAWTEENI